jgi:hypothetical protein
LVVLTGCGAANALANPAVLEALNEPAPMGVIVRRAELARGIANDVDRLANEVPLQTAIARACSMRAADAEQRLALSGGSAVYAKMPIRVLPVEAWHLELSNACTPAAAGATLVDTLGPNTAALYREVASQAALLAELEGDVAKTESQADAPGVSSAQKAQYEARIQALNAKIDAAEAAFDAKQGRLVASVRAAAAATANKDMVRPAVSNLLHAVKDAETSNSMALGRYPLEAANLSTDLQVAAKRFLADIVEEQTGTRPELAGFSPGVGFKNGKVQLTLNGLTAEQIGNVDFASLVAQTVVRTEHYAVFVLGLAGYIAHTQTRLDFQEKVFEAWSAGLGPAAPNAGVLDISAVRLTAAEAKPVTDGPTLKRRTDSPGGLSIVACEAPGQPETAVAGGIDVPVPGVVAAANPVTNSDGIATAPSATTPLTATPGGAPPTPALPNDLGNALALPQRDAALPVPNAPRSGRTMGWVLGAVGVVGIGVGTTTLFMGLHQQRIGDSNCNDVFRVCTPEGAEANDSARTLATVSTVSFIAGAAALGGGVVLLLSGGSSQPQTAVSTSVDRSAARLTVTQRW